MKKKLILGIVAVVLALTLAVAGTLMLFTATSEKVTNVVTIGNASILLGEDGDGEDNDEGGMTWDNTVPGDKLIKEPWVKNTGTIPVYVKVEGIFTITAPDSILKNGYWAKLQDLYLELAGDPEAAQALFADYFKDIIVCYNDDDWDGIPLVFGADFDKLEVYAYGTWYYASGGVDGAYSDTLTPLEADAKTDPIFEGIKIPEEMPNIFQGFTFKLDLKAFAVQSDNVDPGDNDPDSWDAIFPDYDWGYGPWGYQP